MANTDLEIKANVNLCVSMEQAERCLRILEMFLDDHPEANIICERRGLESNSGFVKHYMRIERLRNV